MDHLDKESMQRSAIELVHALRRGDLDAALAFFHPMDRQATKEMLEGSGLDAVLDDLPTEEPEFEWLNTESGSPILNITNSFALMDMGWILVFRDGKWFS